jgi:hypothetical protein
LQHVELVLIHLLYSLPLSRAANPLAKPPRQLKIKRLHGLAYLYRSLQLIAKAFLQLIATFCPMITDPA